MGRKRRKGRGHFCWCCGVRRPNEAFSARGRGKHLCRRCAKLGAEELAFRSVERDIERAIGDDGRVSRKGRAYVERLLEHDSPRVRALAAAAIEADRVARAEVRRQYEEDAWREHDLDGRRRLVEAAAYDDQHWPTYDEDRQPVGGRDDATGWSRLAAWDGWPWPAHYEEQLPVARDPDRDDWCWADQPAASLVSW